MRIVDRQQRIIITDAPERVSVVDRRQRILIGPEPVAVEPEPPVDFFYGISGGLARYDARTLGLADGAPVAMWGDASGTLGDAVCVDPGRCPLYSAARPGVRFDLTGKYLHLPADLKFAITQSWTVVALIDRLSRNPFQAFLLLGQTGGTIEWALSAAGSNRAGLHYGGSSSQSANDAWPNGIGVVARRQNGSRAEAYVDDVLTLTRLAGSTQAEPGALPTVGALVDSAGDVSVPLDAIVHDMLFFTRELSPAELATVRAGLISDWGI